MLAKMPNGCMQIWFLLPWVTNFTQNATFKAIE